ncbi:MAG: alpha-L-rhamnosidase [Puniceicoccaceae bacterium]|nr:MAG: alpha-L-rhamnosidase [Puniceicoccaceae bacterium]
MPTYFSTADWLSAPTTGASKLRPAHYFRVQFQLKGPVAQATLRYAALGVAEPWINGMRVHDDFFTPGWSDYRKRAYVSSYEVGQRLQAGANCLGLVLADGWAGAPFGPEGHAVALAPRILFCAELEVTYVDGTSERIVSAADWQCRMGPIRHQSIYHGETYDARKALLDWTAETAPNRGWRSAEVVEAPAIELTEKKCPPVRITERREPACLRLHDHKWIADFGQNLVGVMRIQLRNTKPGQKIVFKFAEMLQADGSLYLENLRGAAATDVYYCKGGDSESYMPRFTFHGFRYAQVEGYEGLEAQDLIACVLHNDLPRTGQFKCSDPLINQLQDCILWGQRGNFLEAPTDCPQRDERLGWSGDAQVFVETACFNYDCEGFYRQWMDAMRDGQRADGAFPDVAPDILGWHGNAGWGDAGIIVPHAVWLHYGQTAILEENWSAMERYLRFLKKQARDFIQPETVFGDWLAVDAVRPEWGPTPKDLIGTAYFARDAQLMARMAGVLGKTKAAEQYAVLFEKIRSAFQRRFITEAGLVLGDTQTSYLLALGFDLVPEALQSAAVQRLVERIEGRNGHLSTGFLGTPLLNPVLSRFGRGDVAYRLLLQKTYPSWLYPITNGATTMWERWNSWTQEDGFGPVEMNSFNHYAYGAIGEWLYQRVAGIAPHPDYPGYQRAIIAPLPGGGLRSGGGSLKTRAGTFVTKWEQKRSVLRFKCTIPEGADALVLLPAAKWSQLRLDGATPPAHFKCKSTTRLAPCEMLLPAGTYQIEVDACAHF